MNYKFILQKMHEIRQIISLLKYGFKKNTIANTNNDITDQSIIVS